MSVAQPENIYSSEATTVRFQQKAVDISFNACPAKKKTCRLISQAADILNDGPGKARMGIRAYKTTQFDTIFQ